MITELKAVVQRVPGDRIILSVSHLEALLQLENVSSPFTFRLSKRDLTSYAAVQEFTAQEGHIIIPWNIQESMNVKDGDVLGVVNVHLPKANAVTLQPLEAGYDEDWKTLLEPQLNGRATLTKGEVLTILASGRELRFLIHEVEAEDESVVAASIIDTDVEVIIVPLDEQQAIKSLETRDKKKKLMHIVHLDEQYEAAIDGSESFELHSWDRSRMLHFLVESESADVYVSTEWMPSEVDHEWSTLEGPLHIPPSDKMTSSTCLYLTITSPTKDHFSLQITQEPPGKESHAGDNGYSKCDNCNVWIPKFSMSLHTVRCARQNIKCGECGKVVAIKDATSHWHCPDDTVSGFGDKSFTRHKRISHISQICACGKHLDSFIDRARHSGSTCPLKLIICRFCHLRVPQGDHSLLTSGEDILAGYTEHEAQCGGRTTECNVCKRRVPLKSLPVHRQNHEADRLARPIPKLCSNVNCVRTVDSTLVGAAYGLCGICFGPLYNSVFDPDGTKLRSRVERKYITQLTNGCGKPWCRNLMCGTARKRTVPFSEAMGAAKSQTSRAFSSAPQFSLCVDQVTQTRANMVTLLEAHGEYTRPYIAQAVNHSHGDEADALAYLHDFGVRRIESV